MISNNVPQKITSKIEMFCSKISDVKPRYLSYTDAKYGYLAGYCYDNILHYSKFHGGKIISGWIIWQNTMFDLDAEFHAVWESSDGRLFDFTPRVDREEKILFLPDEKRKWTDSYYQANKVLTVDGKIKNWRIFPPSFLNEERYPYSFQNVDPKVKFLKNIPYNQENSIENLLGS